MGSFIPDREIICNPRPTCNANFPFGIHLGRLYGPTQDIFLVGGADGARDAAPATAHAHRFRQSEHHIVPGVGHNLLQEAPPRFAQALLDLL
jgi:pimeloyl-ACP methyl ester carboxylesterase